MVKILIYIWLLFIFSMLVFLDMCGCLRQLFFCIGVVVEVSTKLKGFWKRVFIPHILKKGFFTPTLSWKAHPKK